MDNPALSDGGAVATLGCHELDVIRRNIHDIKQYKEEHL